MSIADYVKNKKSTNSINQMIDEAQRLAGCGISMTQIRGIFGHVRRLDAKRQTSDKDKIQDQVLNLNLLMPRIHYRIKRFLDNPGKRLENPDAVSKLSKELIDAIKIVGEDIEKFERFVEAFETIIAYMPRK